MTSSVDMSKVGIDIKASALASKAGLFDVSVFSIARVLGMLLAVLSILGTIGFIGFGVRLEFGSADERIGTPKASYADFEKERSSIKAAQDNHQADSTLEQKEKEAQQAQAEVEFEKKLKPRLDSILANLTIYSEKLGIGNPSAKAVGVYVRNMMRSIANDSGEEMAWSFVSSLDKATTDLAAAGERISHFTSDDPRRTGWDTYVQWYANAYLSDLLKEQQRVLEEKNRVDQQKKQAESYFKAAAALVGAFGLATIILVLLRIERNTRGVRGRSLDQ